MAQFRLLAVQPGEVNNIALAERPVSDFMVSVPANQTDQLRTLESVDTEIVNSMQSDARTAALLELI
jgi:hypothetical protein